MNVATLCLGILALGEASGYEIKKRFDGPLRRIQEPSFGSIYPALNRLTREGFVTCTVQAQDKRPDKKVYRITAKGRAHLQAELQKSLPGPDKVHSDFLVTMLFQEMLSPAFVAAAVEERIKFYRGLMTTLDFPTGQQSGAKDFVCGYGVAVCRAAIDYLESYRRDLPAPKPAAEPAAGHKDGGFLVNPQTMEI